MIKRSKLLSLLVAALLTILFIHNADANYSIVDVIPVGNHPAGVGVNSVTNRIYVANLNSSSVSVIDGDSNTIIANITEGIYWPRDIGVNTETNRIYVTNQGGNDVTVIDGEINAVITNIAVGKAPAGVCVNPVTNLIYVANDPDNTVSVIDGKNNTVIANITVGAWPRPIDVNPVTNRIYVGNSNADTISVIDGNTNTVIDTISVAFFPGGVGVNQDTNLIYVTNVAVDNVTVIDGVDNSKIDNIPAGEAPKYIAVDHADNTIFVNLYSYGGDGAVSLIDGSSNNVIDAIPVGIDLYGIDINTLTKRVYIASDGDNSVYVLATDIEIVIDIDIKPSSYPNSINLKSKGKVPVAILTTDDFDTYDVDPVTCEFAGAYPLRWNTEDVDYDGDYDILFYFMTQELDLTKESTEATMECETIDEVPIIGTDSVNIVAKGKNKNKKIK